MRLPNRDSIARFLIEEWLAEGRGLAGLGLGRRVGRTLQAQGGGAREAQQQRAAPAGARRCATAAGRIRLAA